jgi:homoserine kinase
MSARSVNVFAPGSIGNVGPGFDVLGLAVDGIGDTVQLELGGETDAITGIGGRDANLIPREPERNCATIAARAMLDLCGAAKERFRLSIGKGLPVSGGLGGSAASSVAGALAAAMALDHRVSAAQIMAAALVGEAAVAGRHLDNIAPCVLGGLALVRSTDPPDVAALQVKDHWWVALVTPDVRVETRAARELLPEQWDRKGWVQQMANTAALVHAFATGDGDLLRRALDDLYAEPRRAVLIPRFAEVKAAALSHGSFGCSISGSGPTVFAIAAGLADARTCANAMQKAFGTVKSAAHVGRIAVEGARPL